MYISPPRGEGEGEDDAALPADMERAYLYFRLKGTGTVPKLSFDRREVMESARACSDYSVSASRYMYVYYNTTDIDTAASTVWIFHFGGTRVLSIKAGFSCCRVHCRAFLPGDTRTNYCFFRWGCRSCR